MDKRETVTVWHGTYTPGNIRVHNNNHSWTLVPSCRICSTRGTVWIREGVPA